MRHESDIEVSHDVREAFGRVVEDMTPLERARVRQRVMSRVTVPARPLPARRPLVARLAAAAAAFLVLTLGTSYAVAVSTPGTLLHPVKAALVRLLDPSDPAGRSDPLPEDEGDADGVIPTPEPSRPSSWEHARSATARMGGETGEMRSEMARLRARDRSRDSVDTQEGGRSAGTLEQRAPVGDGVGRTGTSPSTSGDTSGSGTPGAGKATPDGAGSGPVKSQSGQNGIQESPNGDPVDPKRGSGR